MEAQFSNDTFSWSLQIAKFYVPPEAVYPVFFIGTLIYLFSVLCNGIILALILTQRSLHKPMFYIMFSLPLADLVGISSLLPRLLIDIVTLSNVVYYPTCVLQGFLLHLYAGSVLFVLAAIAFDRYIAICKPLRYHSIMTPFTVGGVIALAWGTDIALEVVLFALQARLPKCKTLIFNVYCDNMSLLKLSCGGDITVNNIYGLVLTGFMQVVSVSIQVFSYTQILKTCISHSQSDARKKAVNTCSAQLITFSLFEIVGIFGILSYRFQNIPPNAQKVCGIMIFTILPVLNPIIYGMNTRDIRNAFFMALKKQRFAFT
ncbi:olfactory receptor 52J3-like [Electrophorus electricus]|uniref:G-protein coupled receptors family 1 profile domain-containing protein n=1 Tax=Electrophorus electricus TaxID=8005 RepID=A0AAY5E9N7_ELEEL|nr:olfactory receptor 52J3-like [Electrophorus electricus]